MMNTETSLLRIPEDLRPVRQVLEILRREVSVCIIIGLTARRGGERKGKEEVESEYVCVEQRRRRRSGVGRGADGDWREEGIQGREVETRAHV